MVSDNKYWSTLQNFIEIYWFRSRYYRLSDKILAINLRVKMKIFVALCLDLSHVSC